MAACTELHSFSWLGHIHVWGPDLEFVHAPVGGGWGCVQMMIIMNNATTFSFTVMCDHPPEGLLLQLVVTSPMGTVSLLPP